MMQAYKVVLIGAALGFALLSQVEQPLRPAMALQKEPEPNFAEWIGSHPELAPLPGLCNCELDSDD